MELEIPLSQGIALRFGQSRLSADPFPTAGLQKGLRLVIEGQELVEEGVGFGVPVIKRGLTTYFPGDVQVTAAEGATGCLIKARYSLNLVERLNQTGNGMVKVPLVYAVKNLLAAFIRRVGFLRTPLTSASSRFRRVFNLQTTYEKSDFSDEMVMVYQIDSSTGRIIVTADATQLPPEVTEVVVMNEQGAVAFDRYGDSGNATLVHDEILCWEPVSADRAWFTSTRHRIAFPLPQIPMAKLFRGRELIDDRLAWSGFGYSFAPTAGQIRYEILIERSP